MRVAIPQANSSLVWARIEVCCMKFGGQLVATAVLYTAGLASMNTRSRGTSTSSKITKASCSSKRLESGWSTALRALMLSRQRNLRPGVAIGIENDSA